MYFKRINPTPENSRWIECFWIIENDDVTPVIQKIIPDGFPEIIFHFGDPYRINLNDAWEIQTNSLLAGQISKYFFLENTGKSSMLGIKLKPAALASIIGIDMETLTDKVYALPRPLMDLGTAISNAGNFEDRISAANQYFAEFKDHELNRPIDKALKMIFETKGLVTVTEMANAVGLSERQLERLFKKHVGLSPKFYCRIIRFRSIFQLHEQGDPSWLDLAYEAGYADQSHFIRNFKAFTGDDPTSYGFDEKNMANFFMKKR
jgi:AraC-like DNA-binding protein